MGIQVTRTAGQLGPDLILAPERFDPRRTVHINATRCLSDLVDIVTENVSAINGHQHIRWEAEMRSNIFTTARPRIDNLDIPFTFEFAGG